MYGNDKEHEMLITITHPPTHIREPTTLKYAVGTLLTNAYSYVQWNLSIKDTLGFEFSSLIQRCPQFRGHLIHYSTTLGHKNGVLITEVSSFQRFGIERSHCTYVHT